MSAPVEEKQPAPEDPSEPAVAAFLARWSAAGASERAYAQLFLTELTDLLGVPRPGNDHAAGMRKLCGTASLGI